MGAAPEPIFTLSHHLPPEVITWRCMPQNFMSGLWLSQMSPKGVWPLSEGRESSW